MTPPRNELVMMGTCWPEAESGGGEYVDCDLIMDAADRAAVDISPVAVGGESEEACVVADAGDGAM